MESLTGSPPPPIQQHLHFLIGGHSGITGSHKSQSLGSSYLDSIFLMVLINLSDVLYNIVLVDNPVCLTVDGSECIFPFKFQNSTYNYCPPNGESQPWCSTQVDTQTGIHIVGKFGICGDGCPFTSGL